MPDFFRRSPGGCVSRPADGSVSEVLNRSVTGSLKNIFSPVLLFSGVVALSLSSAVAAGDNNTSGVSTPEGSPQGLLTSMVKSMESLNYIGEFVHVMGSKVEAMRIVHSMNEGGEYERLTSLNGDARVILRNDEKLINVWPGSNNISVGSAQDRQSLPRIDAGVLQSEFYKSTHEGFDRVASRDAHIISIRSVDDFRYGYRFWIDSESKMLLRMMLVDGNDKPMEQFMFTSIEYPDEVDLSVFAPITSDAAIAKTNAANAQEASDEKVDEPVAGKEPTVLFDSLPGGYSKVAESYDSMPLGKQPMSHVTISDGMASVSVYVEYTMDSSVDSSAEGLSTMGAVNAFTKMVDEAMVTVVGEVPAAVVETISNAVRLENN